MPDKLSCKCTGICSYTPMTKTSRSRMFRVNECNFHVRYPFAVTTTYSGIIPLPVANAHCFTRPKGVQNSVLIGRIKKASRGEAFLYHLRKGLSVTHPNPHLMAHHPWEYLPVKAAVPLLPLPVPEGPIPAESPLERVLLSLRLFWLPSALRLQAAF